MRHRNKHFKLTGSISHRKALLSNLATELFRHKTIKTTLSKAKALKSFSERLITKAKKQTLAAYRDIISHLKDENVAKTLFTERVKEFMERKGGYTRIIKLPPRHGDNSPMAIISLKTKQTPSQLEIEQALPQKEGESITSS